MLFQPSNVTPSSYAGPGADVIDATQGMTIAWQVNGTSPLMAYQIDIYKNDSGSTLLYSTGMEILDDPFYGTDGNGNVQRFSVAIAAATLSANGITNGYASGYKFKIKQWWANNQYVAPTSEYWFSAQKNPVVSITTASITHPSAHLYGSYSQAQGVGLLCVRWKVYVYGNAADPTGGGLVKDSGDIYTSVLDYEYNGWLNGVTYYVVLTYQTQSGYQGTADAILSATWNTYNVTRIASVTAGTSGDCAGVMVKYPIATSGVMTDNSDGTITDDGLVISGSETAMFATVYMEPFTSAKASLAFTTQLTSLNTKQTFSMPLVRMYGAYSNVELRVTFYFRYGVSYDSVEVQGRVFHPARGGKLAFHVCDEQRRKRRDSR